MTVGTLALHAFGGHSKTERELKQVELTGSSMTFSRTAVVLANQLVKKSDLDARQKKLFTRCLETIEEIYKGACAVDNVNDDIRQVWETDLSSYWMFRGIFSRKTPLMCVKSAATTMTSTLDGIIKDPYSTREDSIQQTYGLLMRMSNYCLVHGA